MAFLRLLGIFAKRLIFLAVLFFFLYLQCSLVSYAEGLVSCFPATVITTQREYAEQVIASSEVCSVSVESEKMTFDSSIFNHYEKLPVKEIYLYSIALPYKNWNSVKTMEDSITEANPYIEHITTTYIGSKMKLWLGSFVLSFVVGLFMVFKLVAPKDSSKRRFAGVTIIISACYLACSCFVTLSFPTFLFPLSLVPSVILFIAYLVMSLLSFRMAKNKKEVNNV